MEEIVNDASYWTIRHLETWAQWMRDEEGPAILPKSACGGIFENYTTYDTNNERAWGKTEHDIARNVDAVVRDLGPAYKAAIYRRFLDAIYPAVFRSQGMPYEEMLRGAIEMIRNALRKRGVFVGD